MECFLASINYGTGHLSYKLTRALNQRAMPHLSINFHLITLRENLQDARQAIFDHFKHKRSRFRPGERWENNRKTCRCLRNQSIKCLFCWWWFVGGREEERDADKIRNTNEWFRFYFFILSPVGIFGCRKTSLWDFNEGKYLHRVQWISV